MGGPEHRAQKFGSSFHPPPALHCCYLHSPESCHVSGWGGVVSQMLLVGPDIEVVLESCLFLSLYLGSMEQLYGFVVCKFGLLVLSLYLGGMSVDGSMEHMSTDRMLGSPQNFFSHSVCILSVCFCI